MIKILIFLISVFGAGALAALWKTKYKAFVAVACAAISGAIGWYVLSVNVEQILEQLLPSDPFASAEIILNETYDGFEVRYIIESYGWAIGISYFLIVFGFFLFIKSQLWKKAHNKIQ